jgi:phenylacetic acid degradation operon negative regulatory protein
MQPAAKGFIMDLLSTLRRGAMPVRVLIAAAAIFRIEENAVRVALARLLQEGLVARDERGSYRLGAEAEVVRRRVAAWRKLEERTRPWDGAWIATYTHGRPGTDRKRARRRERALLFLGLRELERGLAVRPDNLAGGVSSARTELRALGLEEEAPVFVIRDLEPAAEGRARRLWSGGELTQRYRTLRADLERSSKRLPRLPEDEAMVESFTLGGEAIRQLALDPLLPEPLVSVADRIALADSLRRYDELGRARWAQFLGRFDLPAGRAPADTGGLSEVPWNAAGRRLVAGMT